MARGYDILQIINLNYPINTNLLHCSSIFCLYWYSCYWLRTVVPFIILKSWYFQLSFGNYLSTSLSLERQRLLY